MSHLLLISIASNCAMLLGDPDITEGAGKSPLIFHSARSFRIPFQIEPADRDRHARLELLVSTDEGATWSRAAEAAPSESSFTFRASGDGMHWFAVRTMDRRGRWIPASYAGCRPTMRVVIGPSGRRDPSPPREEPTTVDPALAYRVWAGLARFGGPACGMGPVAGFR